MAEQLNEAIKKLEAAKKARINGIDRARAKVTQVRVALGEALKALLQAKNIAEGGSREDIDAVCECQC